MLTVNDLTPWYGPHYFRTYRQAPYERSPKWLGVFAHIADGIVREINPRTVLDVGCAMGFLVEALRDRGVDAYGVDLSPHAIAQVRDDIKPYCRVGSLLEESPARYSLVVCHEVIEHLPAEQADAAVARLCAAADDILFSSTPEHFGEDTHLNVRPPEYWAGLFARHGFTRDLAFDGSAFLSPWAVLFRRSALPLHRAIADYERALWALTRERTALREKVLENATTIARQDAALRERTDRAQLEETIEEQKEHLDALNERLQFMSDHENELRRLLIDAHQQLVERDAGLLGQKSSHALQALVDERTAWAQNAVAELERCRGIAPLVANTNANGHEHAVDRILGTRARQVSDLLAKNIQLELQVSALESRRVTAVSGSGALPTTWPELRSAMPMLELRNKVAGLYLEGTGIEVGALHSPLVVSPPVRVRYVDRMTVADLRRQYPELDALPLVEPDILDNGEHLETIETESQDVVIASHFLEHCQDPIGTVKAMLRVVRPGGVLYIAVPDKRFTFDRNRPVTTLEHLIRDHEDGPAWSKLGHFEEWAALAEDANIRGRSAQELIDFDYSIHFHVWTQAEVLELFAAMRTRFEMPFDVETVVKNVIEVIVILRKHPVA